MYAGSPVARLLAVVQELSLARDLDRVAAIVVGAARELTGADAATFVLEGADAQWKASLPSEPVVIPVRRFGVIAVSWREGRAATEHERWLLTALADSAAVAVEHVRRAELAAMLVHDLRSPASGIMLSAKARLRASGLPETARRHWQNVHTAAETIHRMAMNLLDIASSEDGTFVVRSAEVALPALLAEVVELMSPLAASRDQQLTLATALKTPIVRCDGELVRRVLQNLVENALRYTPDEGTVMLEAGEGDGAVELRVTDQGPGVPVEQRRAIFDKYTRTGAPVGRDDAGGRGLGLTFCRLAVERHGGTIDVEAAQPRGSAFVVRLPRPS